MTKDISRRVVKENKVKSQKDIKKAFSASLCTIRSFYTYGKDGCTTLEDERETFLGMRGVRDRVGLRRGQDVSRGLFERLSLNQKHI